MLMPHPLALTDPQLKLIQQSARPLPVVFRTRFLALVADRLLDIDVVTNDDVNEAVRYVIGAMFAGKVGAA